MKKAILLALLLATCAYAEWSDLKEGLDRQAVLQLVGRPLIITRSKSGAQETWTYDCGGYIQFELGRVRFWHAPKPAAPVRTRG